MYDAGLFDGEGSVIIQRSYANVWTLRTSMGLSHKATIERFQATYGGSIHENDTGLRLRGHKMMWQWSTSGKKSVAFLEIVRPYLIIKQAEADLALEFYDGRTGQHTIEEATRAEYYRDQLRALRVN